MRNEIEVGHTLKYSANRPSESRGLVSSMVFLFRSPRINMQVFSMDDGLFILNFFSVNSRIAWRMIGSVTPEARMRSREAIQS